MPTMIPRLAARRLEALFDSFRIVLVYGPRHAGKTTLLRLLHDQGQHVLSGPTWFLTVRSRVRMSARPDARSESTPGRGPNLRARAIASSTAGPRAGPAADAGRSAEVDPAQRCYSHCCGPRSSGDRAPPSGGGCAGSNPAGGAHREQGNQGLTSGFTYRPKWILCGRGWL